MSHSKFWVDDKQSDAVMPGAEQTTDDCSTCSNCTILYKKLHASREWIKFYQKKLDNTDKLYHTIASYERERQHNVDLQLAYDQRTRDISYIREQMATLLLEREPLRKEIERLQKMVLEEKKKREQAECLEHGLRFSVDQQKQQLIDIRKKADVNLIEILEKKLLAARNEIKRLKVLIDDKSCLISESKDYRTDLMTQYERTSKKAYWALKLSKEYGSQLDNQGSRPGSISPKIWCRLESLLEKAQDSLETQYKAFITKENKRLRKNLVAIAALPSLDVWLDDFDDGSERLTVKSESEVNSSPNKSLHKEAVELEKLLDDENKKKEVENLLSESPVRGTSKSDGQVKCDGQVTPKTKTRQYKKKRKVKSIMDSEDSEENNDFDERDRDIQRRITKPTSKSKAMKANSDLSETLGKSNNGEDIILAILNDMKPHDKLSCLESSFGSQDESDGNSERNVARKDVDVTMHRVEDDLVLSDSSGDELPKEPMLLQTQLSGGFSVASSPRREEGNILRNIGALDTELPEEEDLLENGSDSHIHHPFRHNYQSSQEFSVSVDSEEGDSTDKCNFDVLSKSCDVKVVDGSPSLSSKKDEVSVHVNPDPTNITLFKSEGTSNLKMGTKPSSLDSTHVASKEPEATDIHKHNSDCRTINENKSQQTAKENIANERDETNVNCIPTEREDYEKSHDKDDEVSKVIMSGKDSLVNTMDIMGEDDASSVSLPNSKKSDSHTQDDDNCLLLSPRSSSRIAAMRQRKLSGHDIESRKNLRNKNDSESLVEKSNFDTALAFNNENMNNAASTSVSSFYSLKMEGSEQSDAIHDDKVSERLVDRCSEIKATKRPVDDDYLKEQSTNNKMPGTCHTTSSQQNNLKSPNQRNSDVQSASSKDNSCVSLRENGITEGKSIDIKEIGNCKKDLKDIREEEILFCSPKSKKVNASLQSEMHMPKAELQGGRDEENLLHSHNGNKTRRLSNQSKTLVNEKGLQDDKEEVSMSSSSKSRKMQKTSKDEVQVCNKDLHDGTEEENLTDAQRKIPVALKHEVTSGLPVLQRHSARLLIKKEKESGNHMVANENDYEPNTVLEARETLIGKEIGQQQDVSLTSEPASRTYTGLVGCVKRSSDCDNNKELCSSGAKEKEELLCQINDKGIDEVGRDPKILPFDSLESEREAETSTMEPQRKRRSSSRLAAVEERRKANQTEIQEKFQKKRKSNTTYDVEGNDAQNCQISNPVQNDIAPKSTLKVQEELLNEKPALESSNENDTVEKTLAASVQEKAATTKRTSRISFKWGCSTPPPKPKMKVKFIKKCGITSTPSHQMFIPSEGVFSIETRKWRRKRLPSDVVLDTKECNGDCKSEILRDSSISDLEKPYRNNENIPHSERGRPSSNRIGKAVKQRHHEDKGKLKVSVKEGEFETGSSSECEVSSSTQTKATFARTKRRKLRKSDVTEVNQDLESSGESNSDCKYTERRNRFKKSMRTSSSTLLSDSSKEERFDYNENSSIILQSEMDSSLKASDNIHDVSSLSSDQIASPVVSKHCELMFKHRKRRRIVSSSESEEEENQRKNTVTEIRSKENMSCHNNKMCVDSEHTWTLSKPLSKRATLSKQLFVNDEIRNEADEHTVRKRRIKDTLLKSKTGPRASVSYASRESRASTATLKTKRHRKVKGNNDKSSFMPLRNESASEIAARLSLNHLKTLERKRTTILINTNSQSPLKRQKKADSMNTMNGKGCFSLRSPIRRQKRAVSENATLQKSLLDRKDRQLTFSMKKRNSKKTYVLPEFVTSSSESSEGESKNTKKRNAEELLLNVTLDNSETRGNTCTKDQGKGRTSVEQPLKNRSVLSKSVTVPHPGLVSSLAKLGTLDRPKTQLKMKPVKQEPVSQAPVPASVDFVEGLFSKMNRDSPEVEEDFLGFTNSEIISPTKESKGSKLPQSSRDTSETTDVAVFPQQTPRNSSLSSSSVWLSRAKDEQNANNIKLPNMYGSLTENRDCSDLDEKKTEFSKPEHKTLEEQSVKSPTDDSSVSNSYQANTLINDETSTAFERTNRISSLRTQQQSSSAEGFQSRSDTDVTKTNHSVLVQPVKILHVSAPSCSALEESNLKETLEDLCNCRIRSKEWNRMLGVMISSLKIISDIHSSQQLSILVRSIVTSLLRANPREQRELANSLPPTLYKLFQITCVLEVRLGLSPFYLRRRIMRKLHTLLCKPSLKLRPHSIASMTAWYCAAISIPDENGIQHWHQARSFLVDLMFHHPGTVHLALLSAVLAVRKLLIRITHKRAGTGLEKVLHWIVYHGPWVGACDVRTELTEWMAQFGGVHDTPPKDPVTLAGNLLEALAKCSDRDVGGNLLTSIIIFARWMGLLWIRTHLIPKAKAISEIHGRSKKNILSNTKRTEGSIVENVKADMDELPKSISIMFDYLGDALRITKEGKGKQEQEQEESDVVQDLKLTLTEICSWRTSRHQVMDEN